MHGSDRVVVLFADLGEGSSAFFEVSADASHESDIVGRVDEQFDIESVSDLRFCEHEYSFDDYDRCRFYGDCGTASAMGCEVVDWGFDGFVVTDGVDVSGHKFGFEG